MNVLRILVLMEECVETWTGLTTVIVQHLWLERTVQQVRIPPSLILNCNLVNLDTVNKHNQGI